MKVLIAVVTALGVVFVVAAWQRGQPLAPMTIAVVSVAVDGCGAFGNHTCHLLGTADGRVLYVRDDSWVFVHPGRTYRCDDEGGGDVVNCKATAPSP